MTLIWISRKNIFSNFIPSGINKNSIQQKLLQLTISYFVIEFWMTSFELKAAFYWQKKRLKIKKYTFRFLSVFLSLTNRSLKCFWARKKKKHRGHILADRSGVILVLITQNSRKKNCSNMFLCNLPFVSIHILFLKNTSTQANAFFKTWNGKKK